MCQGRMLVGVGPFLLPRPTMAHLQRQPVYPYDHVDDGAAVDDDDAVAAVVVGVVGIARPACAD